MTMVKHAILLAGTDWCEAASSGRVKIYDFRERKLHIRALDPGSVCVVLTKAEANRPPTFYGEFTAVEVKEVDATEYNRLAEEGLIHDPQELAPGEKRWIIRFEEFREYARKILKSELTDVKTSTSKKPIAERAITGLTYIDDQALEGIRKKAGGFLRRETQQVALSQRIERLEERISRLEELIGVSRLVFPLTHECVELMLLSMGKHLGFNVYTADPSRVCGNVRLSDLVDMRRDYLSKYAGPELLEPLSRIDVVWHRKGIGFYFFEVVIAGSMVDALLRLSRLSELNEKLFIVSYEDRRREYENSIRNPTFGSIKNRCTFLSIASLTSMFILTNLWRQSIEPLQLPYVSR